MRFIHCVAVIAFAGMPGLLVAAQAPSNAELTKELDALERRIERLERREQAETKAEKKAAAKATAAAAPAAARKTPTMADWAKVKYNMNEDQVRQILGEPLRTRSNREFQIWSWHDSSVTGGEIWFRDHMAERVYAPK
jgi:hypothetical protein